MWWMVFLATVVSYLIGSIPMGYLVIRLTKGDDIRNHGSGRTGATNAMRAGGLMVGTLTAIGDVLKGVTAIAITRLLTGNTPVAEALAGIFVVVGHNWSIYINFKGGAGTAPNIGVCIMLWPLSALWLIPLVPFGLFVIGYASVTSLTIAAVIPVTLAARACTGYSPWAHVAYGLVAAVAVVWALRPNIKRLIAGTEPRAPRLDLR
jgi:glycerol-3-phosphate acyltransferase PlsY